MKKLHILLFGAALLFSSCTQEPEITEPAPPPASSGLVIKAACTPATRTDINEGKSTWEAGDRITVVYDGAAYAYTAAEAGATTTFTSDAGIASYDASKPLTAYYPATTAEGIVSVEAGRTIAFQGTEQANTACAPLVGTPLENNLSEGTLHVSFRNIFSVIELRIDAGDLESPARSITVEPASEKGFEGYLTFTGTVDPATLALTPAADGTGTKLTLDFPEGADLTKPQTIKFPVGRFTSPAGLKLTLSTADGKSYTKNVYKSGVRTYNETDGTFAARHLAKALYAFAPPGGIWTADDLVEFAAAVNAGETLAPWQNDEGVVVLLDDIDMTGTTAWTPIGDATFALASNAISISSGRPFSGFFDGQDHAICNFKMVCDNATANRAWGLFGALGPGAVVENLIFDASCSLEVKASKGTDCGILAGLVYDATVRNVTNNAPMSFDGSAGNVRMTMGMVGLAFANEGVRIDRLVNEADLTGESGGNTGNGATGVQIGGICGFSTNHASSANPVIFTDCVNRGNLSTKAARASGIVAAANRYTHLTACTNYGHNVNAFATSGNARIGNITCITGTGAKFTKVVNHGDVICQTNGAAGSIVCLVNHDDNEFVGCENYGRVISDRDNNNYKGTFFGQCNKAALFRNCIAQGDVGTYNNGSYVMAGVNADNYMDYLGAHSAAAVNVTRENILYYPAGSNTPAEATFSAAPGSVELNAMGTNAAVVSLSAADYDWTVSTGGDTWVKVTDLNDMPLASGTKSPYVQQIRISADVNPQTEPRPATVTFTSTDQTQTATVSVTQEGAGPAFPGQWVLSASTVGQYNTAWTSSNMLPATSGSSAYISVVRGEANAGREFTRTVSSYKPTVSTMVEGDYWLYTMPVKQLPAGTAIEFNATMAGEANSPKYFIVEYLDGGTWKSVEEDLLTAPEDPSIRYTYKCSGVSSGTNYQHANVMQTIRFTQPVTGAVQIRCRAVGRYTCTGGAQNIAAGNSASLLPPYGFTASYVQNLGTAVPGDTKKVLCLGNSFSYYSNPVWMLKEIAWNEGHYLNIKGHFKGSQNFGQQLGLSFSTDAIDIGGYDYAFIQDQSQNPATYGRDGTASIAANCTALADRIRAKSASCKVILEQTWTFSAGSYGGFTDFQTFENYNAAGARAMAEAAGTWLSPIGVAFRTVREGTSGINLYYTDNKHQSAYGAYLKACVNYLVLYGTAFGNAPADCGIEPSKAAYLRQVAEQVVLGHENEYLIQR